MGKALKKKQRIEAEKQLAYIATLNDKQKTAESSAKFKKQEKKSLLDLPEFMLNNPAAINSIEKFKSSTHSIEKRAKDAITFIYGRYEIKKLFLDLFYKIQCIRKNYKANDERLKAVNYSLEFFGNLVISLGVGISTKSMLQKFLSKREIAVFNTLAGPLEYTSIFELFIYCKCAARGIGNDICEVIIKKLRRVYEPGNAMRHNYNWRVAWALTWEDSFLNITEKKNFFAYEGVCRLIEFLGGWKDNLNSNILADILDFLISKKFDFNYKGRTFNSLVGCVILWHMELNRQENEKKQAEKDSFSKLYPRGPFRDWFNEEYADGSKVTCSQIRTYKTLCEEGRKQHHCVASYHNLCASGSSFIYTLRKYDKKDGLKTLATLELTPDGTIIQARGLLNAALKSDATQILNRWKKERKAYA